MTLKIPIQETVKLVGSLRLCGSDRSEPVVVSKTEMVMDEKVYVAVVARDLESKSSLVWAIQNTRGREFCIVYVHQPMNISAPGEMFHEQKLRLYRKEKEKAHNSLDKYLNICRQMHVNAEKIYMEMDSVEEGILQLISQRGVKKLVMGAAADRNYTMSMRDLKSKKAIYISREAPDTCHIWFTCNGYLICTREAARRDNLNVEGTSSSSLAQSEINKGTESVASSSMAKDDVQIQVALIEAATSNRETRLEVSKRKEAEKSAIDAIKKAKESENGYLNELKRRKETEKSLKEAKEEMEKMRSEAETRIAESNTVITNLQGKYSLSMKVLRRLRDEQEELKREISEVSKLKSKREKEEASPSKDLEPPQYFICPITQEVMEDPYVAADGFTYEGEAIRGWFNRGHETSPMTNKRLHHTSLVPNLALRSAIQEWFQASSS
ncbi:U-box domain-containing protein 36 [Brassica rapa]|uniref:RING-type E3 ubiquitin transferase n=1 Tax=Brassica campestris TaxID=3711 RepID=M4CTQ6_BRACM|nr:U-box domain-containing protein 36 [Brassica rapa]XP_033135009.1 U-box domain-containing protein 36 [Brassica rapa]